jgi:TrmH family RNA methyltransferase
VIRSVTSLANPTIQYVRSLYRRKIRELEKMAVLEGTRLVEDALSAGRTLIQLFCSETYLETVKGKELVSFVERYGTDVIVVPDALINRISDTKTPQGIIAVVSIDEVSFDTAVELEPSFALLLDRVQDPGNVGTLVRTAAAAGTDCVIMMEGSADVYNPKALRASAGAVFRLPIVCCESPSYAIQRLQGAGMSIVVGDNNADLQCFDATFPERVALVVGNEAAGIDSTSALQFAQLPYQMRIHRICRYHS